MPSVNTRGWTWLDEANAPDLSSPRGQAVRARADALMAEWSNLHHDDEQDHWRRLSQDDDPSYAYDDPRHCDCGEGAEDDPDELCSHDRASLDREAARVDVEAEGRKLREELIEAELQHLGIRKMRPYEHWNEDEAYVRYMEEGRFGHYSE